MKDIVIMKSKIQGKGVFAARDFKKGEVIIKWDASDKINKKEYDSAKDKTYLSKVGKIYLRMKAPAKYVNNSCNPNTKVKNFCDVTIRDIKKGEEITGNYADDTGGIDFKCNCKKCKK
jgi:SET domain-containing protein